jgi:hypothetical protein
MFIHPSEVLKHRNLSRCAAILKMSAICIIFSVSLVSSANAKLSNAEAADSIEQLESQNEKERLKAVQQLDEGVSATKVKNAMTALIKQLKVEKNLKTKFWIISIIGSVSAKSDNAAPAVIETRVIPALVETLTDSKERDVKSTTARSLQQVGQSLQNKADTLSLEQLKKAISDLNQAYTALSTADQGFAQSPAANISAAQKFLKREYDYRLTQRITDFLQKNPWLYSTVILLIFYGGTLWLRPQWLLLLPTELKLSWLKPVELPFEIVRYLKYRPRVLDAWVVMRIKSARERFSLKGTVSDRQIHFFSIPIIIDGKTQKLTPQNLQSIFANEVFRVLIYGEGGTGKTSIACQIANWAMAPDEAERLCKHLMLPVLIEEELDFEVPKEKRLKEAIRTELRLLTTDKELISEELVVRLLVDRRILVIVDHFSELKPETQEAIKAGVADLPANAVVITSRNEKILGTTIKTCLKPCALNAELLTLFISEYLSKLDKRSLYSDDAFLRACAHLKEIAGQREVTVLLAKLYAKQMITAKESGIDENFPTSIPNLILSYLNELNQNQDGKNHQLTNSAVRQDAKIIAWECLKKSYQPNSATVDDILAVLGGEDAKVRLEHLDENHLGIVQRQSPEERIRFVLDPIAEYLAALHLLDINRDHTDRWQEFLLKVDSLSIDTIRDFLLAVRDCCLAKRIEVEIPKFLLERLEQILA